MKRLALWVAVMVVGVLALASGVCVADDGSAPVGWGKAELEGFTQVQPGVYEKIMPDGPISRRGEGVGGVDFLLARVEAELLELEASVGPVSAGRARLRVLLVTERDRLMQIRARLVESQQATTEKAGGGGGCLCYEVAKVAWVDSQPYGPWHAYAWGGSCGDTVYDARVASVGVTQYSNRYQACDSDSGAQVFIGAYAPGGLNSRCDFARSELSVDYNNSNCQNDFKWAEELTGGYPEECAHTCW